MQTLGVGIVGYGFAGATWHAPLVQATAGLELVAISSQNPGKVKADWPTVTVLSHPHELLARPDIDLVVLPTPNATHYPLALAALQAGKHVLVDKPFTLHSHEAAHLVEVAQVQQRVLSVFHNRRWDADFLALQQVLRTGQLGRWVHFESHFDRYRPTVLPRWRESSELGGGLWYDLGSHLLDQALCLLGQPESIQLDLALLRDGASTDDWFHAVLHYPKGRAILHASALVAELGPRFVVHGTQGSFSKWGLDPQEDSLRAKSPIGGPGWGQDPNPGTLSLATPEGLTRQTYHGPAGNYLAFYQSLYAALCTGTPPPVTGTEALWVMRWIEAGLRSHATGNATAP